MSTDKKTDKNTKDESLEDLEPTAIDPAGAEKVKGGAAYKPGEPFEIKDFSFGVENPK